LNSWWIAACLYCEADIHSFGPRSNGSAAVDGTCPFPAWIQMIAKTAWLDLLFT
jgi:hypothetical protein